MTPVAAWKLLCLAVVVAATVTLAQRQATAGGRRRRIGSSRLFQHQHPNPSFSMDNLTCHSYAQPLNHFDLPRNASGTYQQRYCTTNMYVHHNDNNHTTAPIFFYTGNESPLEEYVEHTGLLWEMAHDMGAQVVFAEHRYEGQSIPQQLSHNCMAYSSSVQAVADYARLIRNVLWDNGKHPRPVICFGGSYGGMLSAWMRMRYPSYVAGAIAASAPIWGFPQTRNSGLDGAYSVIRHGLAQPYPPNATTTTQQEQHNHCPDNLQASFPLIEVLGRQPEGLDFLTKVFDLCEPLEKASDLIQWLQTPWFDLAEGSFPYPSSYIPYALTHLNVSLPAWPLQAACWKTGLAHNYGVQTMGNMSNVSYTLRLPQSHGSSSSLFYSIDVDWDQAQSNISVQDWITNAPTAPKLLTSLKHAVAIWYNMTGTVQCFDISHAAPNQQQRRTTRIVVSAAERERLLRRLPDSAEPTALRNDNTCPERLKTGSWPALCCNEDMNLIITFAQGLGQDVFWPPTVPRSVQTYQDFVEFYQLDSDVYQDPSCADPNGRFGFPKHADPWSNWLDLQYANSRVWETASNIVFSNGLLDPWSAAGVYLHNNNNDTHDTIVTPGLTLQKGRNGMAALLLKYGGHHTDLMFSDAGNDPPSITAARSIEQSYVKYWIQQFWDNLGQKTTMKL